MHNPKNILFHAFPLLLKTSSLIALVCIVPALCTGCGESKKQGASDTKQNTIDRNASSKPLTIREQLLIDREGLEKKLAEKNLRIVDTRPFDEYATEHIPGAVLVDVAAWKSQGQKEGGLTDAEFWSKAIADLGIGANSEVVVYGGKSPTNTARIWWHLKFAGVKNVKLLDGGWPLWASGKKPTDSEKPEIAATDFQADFQTNLLARKADVVAATQDSDKKTVVVDSRSLGEFEGKDVRGDRGGHIPGAVNIEWKELLDSAGQFKSDEDLKEIFADQDISPGQTVITHCQSGGRSSLDMIGLLLSGQKDVKNYYGSWKEWSADKELPVE